MENGQVATMLEGWIGIDEVQKRFGFKTKNAVYKLLHTKGETTVTVDEFTSVLNSLDYSTKKDMKK